MKQSNDIQFQKGEQNLNQILDKINVREDQRSTKINVQFAIIIWQLKTVHTLFLMKSDILQVFCYGKHSQCDTF